MLIKIFPDGDVALLILFTELSKCLLSTCVLIPKFLSRTGITLFVLKSISTVCALIPLYLVSSAVLLY